MTHLPRVYNLIGEIKNKGIEIKHTHTHTHIISRQYGTKENRSTRGVQTEGNRQSSDLEM